MARVVKKYFHDSQIFINTRTHAYGIASQFRESDMCAVVAASAANTVSKHCPHPPTSNECGLSK